MLHNSEEWGKKVWETALQAQRSEQEGEVFQAPEQKFPCS